MVFIACPCVPVYFRSKYMYLFVPFKAFGIELRSIIFEVKKITYYRTVKKICKNKILRVLPRYP